MPVYAYSVQVDGGAPRRLEIDAAGPEAAAEDARARHAGEGASIEIRRIFRAPPIGKPCPPEAAALPRINYRRSMYERTLRREKRR